MTLAQVDGLIPDAVPAMAGSTGKPVTASLEEMLIDAQRAVPRGVDMDEHERAVREQLAM